MTLYVDHVTVQVPDPVMESSVLVDFFQLLGFEEVDPSADILEKGWNVRWFAPAGLNDVRLPTEAIVHVVAAGARAHFPVGLAHFCVRGVGDLAYQRARRSAWVEHDNPDSPRVWLAGPGGIRVELRP